MNRSVLAAVLVPCAFVAGLLMTGCGSAGAAGTWRLDAERYRASMRSMIVENGSDAVDADGNAISDEQISAVADRFMSEFNASGTLNLRPDGSLSLHSVMGRNVTEYSGTWEETGGRFTITLDNEDQPASGRLDGESLVLWFDDPGVNLPEMRFVRR